MGAIIVRMLEMISAIELRSGYSPDLVVPPSDALDGSLIAPEQNIAFMGIVRCLEDTFDTIVANYYDTPLDEVQRAELVAHDAADKVASDAIKGLDKSFVAQNTEGQKKLALSESQVVAVQHAETIEAAQAEQIFHQQQRSDLYHFELVAGTNATADVAPSDGKSKKKPSKANSHDSKKVA